MLFLQHRLLLSCCQRLVIGGEMLHPRLSSVLPLLLLFCSPSISSADFWKSDKDPLCFNLSTPYPFGLTTSDFIFRQPLEPGFNITCYVTDGPVIHLNGMPYKVLDISLDGYIRIDGSVIAWQCNDGSSGDNVFSLEGTPFTFSDTRNKFTAVGCDAMALIRNGTGGTQSEYSGGCVSFCASQKSIIDGVCSGMGCCQASVPRGLQRLDLVFQSIRKLTRSTEDDTSEPCNWAFVVEQDAYKFSREHLDWSPQNKNKFPRKDLDGSPQNQNVPVVLEWSIGRGSCEEVKNSTDYACKENSDCYNPPNAAATAPKGSEGTLMKDVKILMNAEMRATTHACTSAST